ncbi:MAG: aspartate/tyrosine/aromatic aminotransferase [Burkholderiales bacterium]|nr:aspartate/tyrosine/aromatic aminotransferase [Burkholderiales bacterium]
MSTSVSSVFDSIKMAPDDPILGLNEAFKEDPRKEKVNLGIGVYCTEDGKVPLLSCVEKTEKQMAEKGDPHTYLPISGIPDYDSGVQKLLFGPDSEVIKDKRAATVQTLGGTGALKEGADFLHSILDDPEVLVSTPTWGNHIAIFEHAGFKVGTYPYYDKATGKIEFDKMIDCLQSLEPKTVILMHACCHNPTGVDPTQEQWDEIVQVCIEKDLIPFLDIAYQGFGKDLDSDAYAIRQFADSGIRFIVASSFSKNFSLYGERVGALTVVCKDEDEAKRVLSQIKSLVRANYSNPPTHGAKIVATVLNDPELTEQWHKDLDEMRDRVKLMRKLLVESLKKQGSKKDFSFIENQNGMFSFSQLTPEQIERLRKDYGVYVVKSSRICVASLNKNNVDYTAKAICEVQE